jgi:hypothetical protein
LLSVQCLTPDDGQRNCPKHVEFHSKNKFETLVPLVGYIIRAAVEEVCLLWKGQKGVGVIDHHDSFFVNKSHHRVESAARSVREAVAFPVAFLADPVDCCAKYPDG